MSKIVYGLVNELDADALIFYVGITTKPLPARLHAHINEAKRDTSKKSHYRKNRKIRSIIKTGGSVSALILEENPLWTVEELKEKERWWISYFRSAGVDLTNLTEGGDGTHGYKFTKKQIDSIKKGIKEAYANRGKEISTRLSQSSRLRWDTTSERQAQSEKMKNSPSAIKHRKKLHKKLKGKKLSKLHKSRISENTQKFFDNNPQVKAKISSLAKERYADVNYKKRMAAITKAYYADPANKRKISKDRSKASKVTNSMVVRCATCGLKSTPGPLSIHLKASGHKKLL